MRLLLIAFTVMILSACTGGNESGSADTVEQNQNNTRIADDPSASTDGADGEVDDNDSAVIDEPDFRPSPKPESPNDGTGDTDGNSDNESGADQQDTTDTVADDNPELPRDEPVDQDDDGVSDNQDAFPQDPQRSLPTVSGFVDISERLLADTDLNDSGAKFNDNNQQPITINNIAVIHGFVSKQPTNGRLSGNKAFENFADRIDEFDLYRAILQQGQILNLQNIDSSGEANRYSGDIDLYLCPYKDNQPDLDSCLVSLNEDGAAEQIVVEEDGEYLIAPLAFSGISKYILDLASDRTNSIQQQPSVIRGNAITDQVIVQFQRPFNTINDLLVNNLSNIQITDITHFELTRASLLTFAEIKASSVLVDTSLINQLQSLPLFTLAKVIKQLRKSDLVLYAEPNYQRQIFIEPDDEFYKFQWHYENINLPSAWDISESISTTEDVIVSVVDTGVFISHIDLNQNLIAGFDFIRDPQSSADGDGIDVNPDDPGDGRSISESSWHGTHVAGTIAAVSNNIEGVSGVALSGIKVMPMRALGITGGTSYDILQAVRYSAGLSNDSGRIPFQPADIINLSLGGPGASTAENNLYQTLFDRGIITVAAAGNDNSQVPAYPASYDSVISVAATDLRDVRTGYSNFGPNIALAAPGGDLSRDRNFDTYPDGILSTYVAETAVGERRASAGFLQGTSMAAPHVAGVAALMKKVNPELSATDFFNFLSQRPESPLSIVDDLGQPGRDDFYGAGLINAAKAVQVSLNQQRQAPEEVESRVILQASPKRLALAETSTGIIELQNIGNEEVKNITADVLTSGSLSVSSINSNQLQWQVDLNRSELDRGIYVERIRFSPNNGEAITVEVSYIIGDDQTVPYDFAHATTALITEDFSRIIAQVSNNPDGSYQINNVPAGRYYVISSTDIDVDFNFCEDGEICGAFPTLSDPQLIDVKNSNITDLSSILTLIGNVR